MTVVVWALLRGAAPDAMPRAPPAVWQSLRGACWQIVGTPRGPLRWALSVPLLDVMTRLYSAALGAGVLDQMVLINDPMQAVLPTMIAVNILIAVRTVATMFLGPTWPGLKKRLGRRGEERQVSEARVLRAVTLLPLLLVPVPAVWLAVASGPAPLAAFTTLTWLAMTLGNLPLYRWCEGGTGASVLASTTYRVSSLIGGTITAAVLGGYASQVKKQVAEGAGPADVAGYANVVNLRLALVAVALVVVGAVVGDLVARSRVGTLDELAAALRTVGAGEATITHIVTTLAGHGLRDVGSIRALYRPGWTPLIGRGWRLHAHARRRADVGLTDDDVALLRVVVEAFRAGPATQRR